MLEIEANSLSSDPELITVLQRVTELKRVISANIVGKEVLIDRLVIALMAEGSVLLEDVPGVGKTTLAKAFAAGLGLSFRRVQCTPDLLPSDVIGFSVFRPDRGEFTFQPGPIFCNVLLLDEVNRASPRTQSALLEAMAERQVTIEGHRRELTSPFLVVATQNPSGYEGTFPLPESQLDRFLFKLCMNYPDLDEETRILQHQLTPRLNLDRDSLLNLEDVCHLQKAMQKVRVAPSVLSYLVAVVRRTRIDPRIKLGVSPRGAIMLLRAIQGRALLNGRNYAIPDDVQHLACDVLGHRIVTDQQGESLGPMNQESRGSQLIQSILKEIDVPT